ncbi:MAG: hydroxymethylglutaryl-CoA lyase [Planctomycetota bacterium]|nr:MAG: hydroxymethylglutaryl-CoA lyase [Planctomycetota bacterium]
MLSERVEITETLRDAWQGLPHAVPTAAKLTHIQRLLDAGFRSLDIGSFVSPKAVPAMADTGELPGVLRVPEGASLMALVANEKGLERFLEHPQLHEVLYPFSLSESFQQRNTRRSREDALHEVTRFAARAHESGRVFYTTISMAFGNNEGDAWSTSELVDWVGRLQDAGTDRLGLADTTAQADPERVAQAFEACRGVASSSPAAHLHCTLQTQHALVQAALDAGCRAFDAALGGLGGCQFAKGPESNVSTRELVQQCAQAGFDTGLADQDLDALDAAASSLAS